MIYQHYVIARLFDFAAAQGLRYGGTDNAMAAAEVIANRVRAGWFGGDWLQVLDRADESAGTVYGSSSINPRDGAFRQLLSTIDDVYHGRNAALIEGALFFADLNQIDREWFRWHVLRHRDAHPLLGTVGPVTFFA